MVTYVRRIRTLVVKMTPVLYIVYGLSVNIAEHQIIENNKTKKNINFVS